MPRIKPLGSPEMKAQVQAYHAARKRGAEEDEQIKRELRMLKGAIGKTHTQIATMLGMSADTWRYRRANPSSFKLSEIRILQELAKIYSVEVSV